MAAEQIAGITPAQSADDLVSDDALAGETILARDVLYEDYLAGKYGRHVEWVNGVVIAMSPVSVPYKRLDKFLVKLFEALMEITTGGEVLGDPVVMKALPDLLGRQPDIMVILPDRFHQIQTNQVAGPANLVVEIVSPESVKRDRGVKFDEYEKGGVDEYWIVDRLRREALFYVRNAEGMYQSRLPVDGVYTAYVLPKLRLPVELLWREEFPTVREIVAMVECMVSEA
jgi:Uma2 family endonuclease